MFLFYWRNPFPWYFRAHQTLQNSGLRGWKFRGVTRNPWWSFSTSQQKIHRKWNPMEFFCWFWRGPIPNPNTNRPYRAHILPNMFLEPWGLDLYFWRSFPPKNKVQTPTKTRVIKGFQVLLKKKIEDNNHQPTVTVTGNSGLLADVKAAASGAKAGLDKFWPKIFCRQNLVWICKKWWKNF